MDIRLRGNNGKLYSTRDRLVATLPLAILFGTVGVSGLARALMPQAFPQGRTMLDGLVCPGVLISLVVAGVVSTNVSNRKTRLLTMFGAPRCCDCNYDLSSLPSAIDPARIEGLETGPSRCPECGAPWPMVPPRAS